MTRALAQMPSSPASWWIEVEGWQPIRRRAERTTTREEKKRTKRKQRDEAKRRKETRTLGLR
jgi:hypothetical protein